MKNSIRYLTFLTLVLGMLFTSCVSNKKFMASEARADKLQKDNANTQSQLNESNMQLMKVKNEKATMQKENEMMQKEYALIQKNLMMRSSESKMTIAEQARRLNSLQEIIDNQSEITNRLKTSIAKALMNYKADELTVYLKDGNVYVSLAEKLLFKSGSDVVDPKGKSALKTLATVLNSSKDFTVAIEGHTDDVPIKTRVFKDNWDLSAGRATSIVRILTDDYGFDPNRITASGKGQFHPVELNTTAEGRAGNRRTEVILSPDLQEIYKLLYQ
ncbi:MAG TPA: OmpA family protein [Prolixibacteraceae bacterium]|nr:OmpA family protein [Prolixibacteraceae bacterium]